MKTTAATASMTMLVLLAAPSFAQTAKKPAVGTLGTAQMPGGTGAFGATYSVGTNGGDYNLSIVSAEYVAGRFNADTQTAVVPKPDEKLLVLHLRIQNPLPSDEYISGSTITFSTVGMDDITRNDCSTLRLASAKKQLEATLKPGQKFPEEVLCACTVPAVGPVPKLILNLGRIGTSDQVFRFFLGKGPNKVKPLPAAYADPSDPTGATVRAEIPAKLGQTYASGHYDLTVTSIAYLPGPIGTTSAGDNNQFLVATVTATNKTWNAVYTGNVVNAQLTTDDDEKTTTYTLLKGKRDEPFEGRDMDPDDPVTIRLAFAIPKNAKGTKLKMAEWIDGATAPQNHPLVYDVPALQ